VLVHMCLHSTSESTIPERASAAAASLQGRLRANNRRGGGGGTARNPSETHVTKQDKQVDPEGHRPQPLRSRRASIREVC
jgi:hypothetical protein